MAMQTYVYDGTTEWASSEAEAFAISYGTPVQVTCVYDISEVPQQGEYAWETNLGQNGSITGTIGGLNLSSDGDTSGSPGWPLIQFDAQQFAGINYVALFPGAGIQYQFTAQGAEWSIVILGAEQTEIANGSISLTANESASTQSA
jgi:hypothetical protein